MKPTKEGLKSLRLRRKHTQRDASLIVGVSMRTWRRYEAGSTAIPQSVWNWYKLSGK